MNANPEPVGVGDTAITGIDGARGVLTYRGFRIQDVVGHLGYEEVVSLLLSGNRPDERGAQEVQN
ncbi:MAG: citrate/2-methylcitrate synthase, partial [Thermoplasmata archaeon]|nr:citrate/2-methylcitrate synthase [Thermoplasmata archaeon]